MNNIKEKRIEYGIKKKKTISSIVQLYGIK